MSLNLLPTPAYPFHLESLKTEDWLKWLLVAPTESDTTSPTPPRSNVPKHSNQILNFLIKWFEFYFLINNLRKKGGAFRSTHMANVIILLNDNDDDDNVFLFFIEHVSLVTSKGNYKQITSLLTPLTLSIHVFPTE